MTGSGMLRRDVKQPIKGPVKPGKKYFLAVISGLEEGKDTEMRIFADPVRTFPLRRLSRIRLGGILSQSSHSLLLTIATPD